MGELHIVRKDVLLWALGGFAQPQPAKRAGRLTWKELRPQLEKLWAEGLTAREIAIRLERTPYGVKTMRCRFKLPRRCNPGVNGFQHKKAA